MQWFLTQENSPAAGQLGAIKRAWFGDKDTVPESRTQMDHVENPAVVNRVAHHRRVSSKLRL